MSFTSAMAKTGSIGVVGDDQRRMPPLGLQRPWF
jgi:hypothetical protein